MIYSERVYGLVELTRPMNSIAAGVLTFSGGFVAHGAGILSGSEALLTTVAIVVTILATGAGMAINDVFDREIDRITNPRRPIPHGVVTYKTALIFSIALFCIAGALTLLLPVVAFLIAAVNIVLLVTYTTVFKGLPGAGNVIVAYLGGSTFLFGAAAVDRLTYAIGVLFLLAALSTLSREIIKDVEDVAGDRKEGLNTLPIVIGEQRSLVIAAIVLMGAIATSPVPYLLGTFGAVYLVLVTPAVLIMLYSAYVSFSDPTQGQSTLKYGMFLAAAAFIASRALQLF